MSSMTKCVSNESSPQSIFLDQCRETKSIVIVGRINKFSCQTIRMKVCSPTGLFSCKSNSLSREMFYKKPRFETEAHGNSETAHF